MQRPLSDTQLHRLDVQGFDAVEVERLAEAGPWLRMAFTLCAGIVITATVLASVPLFLIGAGIAALAALSPVHPFDLIYNLGIRHIRGTGPLPRRPFLNRLACAMGAVLMLVAAWAFSVSLPVLGYAIGIALSVVAGLVGTVDICIPSMTYRAIFGPPEPRVARAPATDR